MKKATLIDKLLFLVFRIPAVKNFWVNNFEALFFDHIPWTKLKKPLSECKIVLITTGGIHLKSDEEFDLNDPHGDCSFRRIPSNVSTEDLTITHKYYDHRDADLDPNLILPFEVLLELQAEGRIGSSNKYHYSFMGHIEEPNLSNLIQESALDAAKEIKQQKVDVALLVPA